MIGGFIILSLKNDHGAMGVIGVILLVAITVALGATIYLMLQSFTPPDSGPLAVVFNGRLDDMVVSLTPQAGARLSFNSTKVSITVNGLLYPVDIQTYISSPAFENGIWESGETLTVDLSELASSYSTSQSVSVTIVNLNGNTLLYDKTLRTGASGIDSLETPQVVTLAASNITFLSAQLHMTFSLGSYPSVDVGFQYKTLSSGTWSHTGWISKNTAGIYSYTHPLLSSNTTYQVKAQVRYGVTILTGEQRSFTTNTGPIAFYQFNEGTGSTALDSIGDHTGTINGATWTTGIDEEALSFDGVDDYITVNNAVDLNPTSALSLTAWVKWTIDPETGTQWASIINKNGDGQYRLQHNQRNTKFEFAIRTSSGNKWVESLTTPQQDTWYFVVGTYDGSTVRIYVNGVLEQSTSHTGYLLTSTSPVNIARRAISNDRYFNGVIDEVSIWNKALSSTEIKEYYDLNKP